MGRAGRKLDDKQLLFIVGAVLLVVVLFVSFFGGGLTGRVVLEPIHSEYAACVSDAGDTLRGCYSSTVIRSDCHSAFSEDTAECRLLLRG